MYTDRNLMPRSLKKKILKEFHTDHPGMTHMKSLMRSYTYWPRIDQGIEKMDKGCRGCQPAAKAPPIKTQPWPKTDIPWTCVHVDYAGPLNGYYYLIIIDSFAKWQEIYKFRYPTSTNTTKGLDEIFSRFGVPEILVSDNGTMFTGKEFKNYCSLLAIEHITTPAYNPRSNGTAEKFIDKSKER